MSRTSTSTSQIKPHYAYINEKTYNPLYFDARLLQQEINNITIEKNTIKFNNLPMYLIGEYKETINPKERLNIIRGDQKKWERIITTPQEAVNKYPIDPDVKNYFKEEHGSKKKYLTTYKTTINSDLNLLLSPDYEKMFHHKCYNDNREEEEKYKLTVKHILELLEKIYGDEENVKKDCFFIKDNIIDYGKLIEQLKNEFHDIKLKSKIYYSCYICRNGNPINITDLTDDELKEIREYIYEVFEDKKDYLVIYTKIQDLYRFDIENLYPYFGEISFQNVYQNIIKLDDIIEYTIDTFKNMNFYTNINKKKNEDRISRISRVNKEGGQYGGFNDIKDTDFKESRILGSCVDKHKNVHFVFIKGNKYYYCFLELVKIKDYDKIDECIYENTEKKYYHSRQRLQYKIKYFYNIEELYKNKEEKEIEEIYLKMSTLFGRYNFNSFYKLNYDNIINFQDDTKDKKYITYYGEETTRNPITIDNHRYTKEDMKKTDAEYVEECDIDDDYKLLFYLDPWESKYNKYSSFLIPKNKETPLYSSIYQILKDNRKDLLKKFIDKTNELIIQIEKNELQEKINRLKTLVNLVDKKREYLIELEKEYSIIDDYYRNIAIIIHHTPAFDYSRFHIHIYKGDYKEIYSNEYSSEYEYVIFGRWTNIRFILDNFEKLQNKYYKLRQFKPNKFTINSFFRHNQQFGGIYNQSSVITRHYTYKDEKTYNPLTFDARLLQQEINNIEIEGNTIKFNKLPMYLIGEYKETINPINRVSRIKGDRKQWEHIKITPQEAINKYRIDPDVKNYFKEEHGANKKYLTTYKTKIGSLNLLLSPDYEKMFHHECYNDNEEKEEEYKLTVKDILELLEKIYGNKENIEKEFFLIKNDIIRYDKLIDQLKKEFHDIKLKSRIRYSCYFCRNGDPINITDLTDDELKEIKKYIYEVFKDEKDYLLIYTKIQDLHRFDIEYLYPYFGEISFYNHVYQNIIKLDDIIEYTIDTFKNMTFYTDIKKTKELIRRNEVQGGGGVYNIANFENSRILGCCVDSKKNIHFVFIKGDKYYYCLLELPDFNSSEKEDKCIYENTEKKFYHSKDKLKYNIKYLCDIEKLYNKMYNGEHPIKEKKAKKEILNEQEKEIDKIYSKMFNLFGYYNFYSFYKLNCNNIINFQDDKDTKYKTYYGEETNGNPVTINYEHYTKQNMETMEAKYVEECDINDDYKLLIYLDPWTDNNKYSSYLIPRKEGTKLYSSIYQILKDNEEKLLRIFIDKTIELIIKNETKKLQDEINEYDKSGINKIKKIKNTEK